MAMVGAWGVHFRLTKARLGLHWLRRTPRTAPPRHLRRFLRAAASHSEPSKFISVYFKSHDVLVDASPGDNILEVAHKCGIEIPTGCLTGSCGTCEVEVSKGGSEPHVVRACIASLPVDVESVVIDDIADAIWGVDGMDL